MQQTYRFYIAEMHCRACVLLTEGVLGDLPGVTKVKADLANLSVEVTGEFGDKTPVQVAALLSPAIAKHGYTVALAPPAKKRRWGEFAYAVPAALLFLLAFAALQKLGIANLITADRVSYGTAFAVGVVASLSTCMAVVGGLVLSMSATFAKEGDRVKPQALFHAGRIAGFFALGGVIGALGSAFRPSDAAMLALNLLVGAVMLVMGINLLDTFDWARRLQPTMPKFAASRVTTLHLLNHRLTPLLIGAGTFFLPCGFTQSMQLYALSTGSFLTGALTMLAFALGTLPVLAALSFGSSAFNGGPRRGVFFKAVGLVVIAFASFNILNALAAAGVIRSLFTI